MLRTGAASVHIDGCHERLHRERKASPLLVNWLYPLYELGRICGPGVWCGWCSVPPGGPSRSPLCMQNQKDTQSWDPRASSQWCLSKNKIKENESKPRVWARNPSKSLFTCMYIRFAQEQRQTLHCLKWVEVVNTLMKAVHAILVLKRRPDNLESHRLDANSTHTQTVVLPAAARSGWQSGWGSSCWQMWMPCWTPNYAEPEHAGGEYEPQSYYTPLSQNLHHQLDEVMDEREDIVKSDWYGCNNRQVKFRSKSSWIGMNNHRIEGKVHSPIIRRTFLVSDSQTQLEKITNDNGKNMTIIVWFAARLVKILVSAFQTLQV